MAFHNISRACFRGRHLTKLLATGLVATGCSAADAPNQPSPVAESSTAVTVEANTNACATGLTKCGNDCVNLSDDEAHCGSCKTVCASGDTCRVGRCAQPGMAVMIVAVNVINDNGGTVAASDVTFSVSTVRAPIFGLLGDPTLFHGSTSGTPVLVWPGYQFFSIVSFPGYTINFTTPCAAQLVAGQIARCDITLTDN